MSKTYRICPASATYYSDLVQQFGANNVFRSSDARTDFTKALGAVQSGMDDRILFYPGTYIWGASSATNLTGVPITKQVRIASATGNPADVILTSVIYPRGFFKFATGSSGSSVSAMRFQQGEGYDGIIVDSGVTGITIRNCVFEAGDYATISIDAEGDRLSVTNCRFEDVPEAIQSNGNYCEFRNNYFNSDNVGAVGLSLLAGNWNEVINNRFDLSGGTGDTGLKIANGCLLGICQDNVFHASCNDAINPGTSTMAFKGNEKTGTTGTIAYVVT